MKASDRRCFEPLGLPLGLPLSPFFLLTRDALGYAKDKCTPHGFRSSFRDWAAEETHFPSEVVETGATGGRALFENFTGILSDSARPSPGRCVQRGGRNDQGACEKLSIGEPFSRSRCDQHCAEASEKPCQTERPPHTILLRRTTSSATNACAKNIQLRPWISGTFELSARTSDRVEREWRIHPELRAGCVRALSWHIINRQITERKRYR